jgi:hypothetical protein
LEALALKALKGHPQLLISFIPGSRCPVVLFIPLLDGILLDRIFSGW